MTDHTTDTTPSVADAGLTDHAHRAAEADGSLAHSTSSHTDTSDSAPEPALQVTLTEEEQEELQALQMAAVHHFARHYELQEDLSRSRSMVRILTACLAASTVGHGLRMGVDAWASAKSGSAGSADIPRAGPALTDTQMQSLALERADKAWVMPGNGPESALDCACWTRFTERKNETSSEQDTKAEL
jgi:cell wall-associated NlpC family hydrolase